MLKICEGVLSLLIGINLFMTSKCAGFFYGFKGAYYQPSNGSYLIGSSNMMINGTTAYWMSYDSTGVTYIHTIVNNSGNYSFTTTDHWLWNNTFFGKTMVTNRCGL